eukprot:6173725-Pleurochrysis_carterae.AAC.4
MSSQRARCSSGCACPHAASGAQRSASACSAAAMSASVCAATRASVCEKAQSTSADTCERGATRERGWGPAHAAGSQRAPSRCSMAVAQSARCTG